MIGFVRRTGKESVIYKDSQEVGLVKRSTEKNKKVWIILSRDKTKLCKVYHREHVRPVCEGIFR